MKNESVVKKERGDIYEKIKGVYRKRLLIGVVIIAIGIIFMLLPIETFFVGIIVLVFIGILEMISVLLKINKKNKVSPCKVLMLFFFAIYFCSALLAFCYLRAVENGLFWVLIPLVAAGTFDSSAHLAGKVFGKYKITRNISPNKTLEGTLAGFVACTMSVLIVMTIIGIPKLRLEEILFSGIILASCAFFGDLIESFVKRKLNIKDFGNLLQKHGGLLDRVDSALLAVFGVLLIRHLSFLWQAL